VVAAKGEGQLAVVGCHKAGEGDGEVKAERNVPASVVLEAVDLLVCFPSALTEQDFGVLQGRGIDGHVAEEGKGVFQFTDQGLLGDFLLRQRVSEAFEYFGRNNVGHVHTSEGNLGTNRSANYALTFRSLQIIMKLIIILFWKDIQPLLLRYTTDESGKTAVQAEIYTKDDHGIGKEKIDPDAYMITRRLRQLDFEAYIVGGAVRDLLLGREPKDYDIATNATPRQLKRIFTRSRIIGRRFRLVHVYFRGMKFIEVATFRSGAEGDANTFGTLEEDVRRRDFSLNALYYCPRDEYIIDHVGGVKDIRKRRLENVIPLDHIFAEDPVRMLRGVKYAVITDCRIPSKLAKAVKDNAQLMQGISASRLTEEFFKVFLSGHAFPILKDMVKLKLLASYIPALAHFLAKGKGSYVREFWKAVEALDQVVLLGEEVTRAEVVKALISSLLKQGAWDQNAEPVEFTEVKHYIKELFVPIVFSNKELEISVDSLYKEWGLPLPKKKRRPRRRIPRTRSRRRGPKIESNS
jgi:poly(A) polymerase